jgi:hypothetical protein
LDNATHVKQWIAKPTVLEKLKGLHRELGPHLMIDYLARRMLNKLGVSLYRYRLVAQPVPPKARLPERHRAAFEFREVTREQYDPSWFPRPQQVIEQRFAQGARCWVAFKDDRAVACQWFQPGPYLEDEVRCRFVPLPTGKAAWDFDIYVLPELRMGRLFMLMWDHTDAWMRDHGIDWAASRIDSLNTVSLRSHQRMGAQIVGQAWFIRVGHWQLSHSPNGWRLSRSPADIPDIPVAAPVAHQDPA